MNKEVRDAVYKFEADFEFSKMETMIHRFPAGAGLGDGLRTRYPHMVAPRFVAIGPYHHGEKRLAKMEGVKSAAAYYVCLRAELAPEMARQAVLAVADEARGKYYDYEHDDGSSDGGGGEEGGKACFAAMMFRDACFLLLYMDAYTRSYGDTEDDVVNKSMRRFLFANRESINSDIMLLENQLPWLVVQALLGAFPGDEVKTDMRRAVGTFVAAMGNSFRISEPCKLVRYEWDDERDPPAHLLALLRRHKTEKPPEAGDDGTQGNGNGNHNAETMRHPLITPPPPAATAAAGRRKDDDGDEENPRPRPQAAAKAPVSVSATSPADLEQIGIKLTPSRTASFSDMGLEKGRLFVSRLTLAPLSLSDARAACLVNMAALEVCCASRFGDRAGAAAVCSYLALLAFLMAGPEDVRRLRALGLLHGPRGDGDTLAFFSAAAEHLPSYGKRFALLMAEVQEYKRTRRVRTALYRWVHNHLATVVKVVSIIAMLVGLYQGLIFLTRNG